jgi:hypothetical protein
MQLNWALSLGLIWQVLGLITARRVLASSIIRLAAQIIRARSWTRFARSPRGESGRKKRFQDCCHALLLRSFFLLRAASCRQKAKKTPPHHHHYM